MAMLAAGDDAWAADLPALGAGHRSTVFVYGKPVPLPPGEWTVVGRGHGPVVGAAPGPYGAIGGIVLVQQQNGLVEGIVVAHANRLPVDNGWGPPAGCRDPDAVYATGVRTRARNLACGYLVFLPAGHRSITRLPAWNAARNEALRRGWRIPGALAVAGLRVGDRRDVVDIRYAWAATQQAAPRPPAQFERAAQFHRAALVSAEPPALRIAADAMVPWLLRALDEVEGRIADPLAATSDLPPPGAASRSALQVPGTTRWHRRLGMAASEGAIQVTLAAGAGLIVAGNAYTAVLLGALQTLVGGLGAQALDLAWDLEPPRPTMEFGIAPSRPSE